MRRRSTRKLEAAGPNPGEYPVTPARLIWLAFEGEGWLPTLEEARERMAELLRSERELIDRAANKQRMEEARERARAMLR